MNGRHPRAEARGFSPYRTGVRHSERVADRHLQGHRETAPPDRKTAGRAQEHRGRGDRRAVRPRGETTHNPCQAAWERPPTPRRLRGRYSSVPDLLYLLPSLWIASSSRRPTIIGTESRVQPIGLGVPGSDGQSPTIFGARPLVSASSAHKWRSRWDVTGANSIRSIRPMRVFRPGNNELRQRGVITQGETCPPRVPAVLQTKSSDFPALVNLLFCRWHEPAGCWQKWSGQSG